MEQQTVAADWTVLETYQAKIDQLTKELEAAHQRERTNLQRWQQDIAWIGECWLEAAEKHDLCSLFDEYLDQVNARLYYTIEGRERDWYVVQTYRVVRSATIRATSADQADEDASVAFNRAGLADSDWDIDDIDMIEQTVKENN